MKVVGQRVFRKAGSIPANVKMCIRDSVPTREELEKQKKRKWKYAPKISVVVPAYQTPEKFLCQMMDSLLEQTYENWELCIADASPENASMEYVLKEYAARDSRIRWKKLEKNMGIAENTNQAFAMAVSYTHLDV